MAGAKKMVSIRMAPHTLKGLKLIAVQHDRSIGDVVEALVDLFHTDDEGTINDQAWNDRFRGIKLTALANAGNEAAWRGDEVEPSIEHFNPADIKEE